VYALFGTHGQLPIVVGTFGEGYVLVDATNGAVDGPYEFASVIDPVPLLLGHTPTYVSGSGVDVVDGEGCEQTTAKEWKPGPLPWTPLPVVPGPLPKAPPCPRCPSVQPNPAVPGHYSPYVCVGNTLGCACTSYGEGTIPGVPGTVPERLVCRGDVCDTNGTPPNAPIGMLNCTKHYYY